MGEAIEKIEIETPKCKKLTVFVQGELSKAETRAVFLTVHDMGNNHQSMLRFVEHPCMREVKARSIFIHICLPGQEDDCADLPSEYDFPTMQTVADELMLVQDHFKVKDVIGLGEGAGANILARYGMAHPERVMGLILVHCTSTTAGVMEHFKDKIINWKLNNIGSNTTAEQYLILHKFGHRLMEHPDSPENNQLIKDYQERLKLRFNPRNLRRYIETFLKRSDISSHLERKLEVETLLVTGSKSSHVNSVNTMHQACNKTKVSLLKIDDVGDVLQECPDKFAQSLILFCKGLGVLTSVPMTGIERQRTFSGGSEEETGGGGHGGKLRRQRTMSMEEYDTPNLRRFSFSNASSTAN